MDPSDESQTQNSKLPENDFDYISDIYGELLSK
jgi:hypothetical protein